MFEVLRQAGVILEGQLRAYGSDPQVYLQVSLFVVVAGVAWLLARRLQRVQWRMPGSHWQGTVGRFLFPLLGLLGGRLVSAGFEREGQPLPLFDQLYSLFWILLVYRAAMVVVERATPDNAELVRRRIVIPSAILFVVLRLLGQLGALLQVVFRTPIIEGTPLTLAVVLFGPLALLSVYAIAQGVRAILIDDVLPQTRFGASRAFAIGTLVGYAIVVAGVLGTMVALGVELSTLAVVGSALAVGVGFGLQNTVNNFVSGFLIMFDPLISVGDTVEVAQERGVIRYIGVRNTMIETADGTQVVMPNATLASTPILNLNRSARTNRVALTLPVSLAADPRQVEAEIRAILAAHPDVRPQPAPGVTLRSFAGGAMNFEVAFWTATAAQVGPTTHAINLEIWQRLHALGYDLAPPVDR